MNEIKLQQAILAQANKNRVRFGKLEDGRMGVTIDGVSVNIINSDNVFLDTSKFLTLDLQKFFDDIFDAKAIIPTGVSVLKGKDTLKEFKNEETTAYFNEKLFKYFDSKKKLTYSYHKTKLFVFENGVPVGLVLETRMKSEVD